MVWVTNQAELMTTLKSKIIRNFIAGILACVLVFSILVTLFVTFNYRELLSDIPDYRPNEVSFWFKNYIKDPNITIDQMWENLDDLAKDLEVDIKYEDSNGNTSYEVNGRDKNNTYPLLHKNINLVNLDRKQRSGTLTVTYNANPEPIHQLQKNFSSAIVYSLLISLVIGIIISLILSDNISEPIMTISDDAVKIKNGDYNIINQNTDIVELENLQDNITYLSKNLKNQEEIRKQYAQDISHELRTPLTNLQLYIEAIRDGVIEADETTMDILLEDVTRLEGLVIGLKKTFDENVKYFEVKDEEFDLSLLINRIIYTFMPNANNNRININSHIEYQIVITSDKDKFTQVIQNLISNAIKAIGQDGNIDVFLSGDPSLFEIKVIDDGVGIAEDKIDRIFERFYRIEDARNTNENGHGLGLSITKNFVEALGGKIEVESVLNQGTTFILTFKN